MASLKSVRSRREAYRALSCSERSFLMRSALSLPLVTLLLRTVGYRRTRSVLGRLAEVRRVAAVSEPDGSPILVASAVRMMDVAAANSPFPSTCLSRALGVWFWLCRRGVECRVQLGVRQGQGSVEAHAWVAGDGADGPEEFTVIYPGTCS